MGDGLMLEFPSVQPAIRSAFAIQHACAQANAGVPPDRQMLLRMGAHVGQLIADEHDIYGHGVNLAARLTTLAGPGEIVVSADVRDQLIPVLDADIEDLGACYVKHVNEPVRAYRVGPPGPRPVIEPGSAAMPELRPTVAVIPFTARGGEAAHQVLGEVLADEIISALSRAADLNVISRLSTTVFRGRDASLGEVGGYLNATYVLSGAYLASGNQFNLSAELADAKSGNVVWAKSLKGQVTGIVSGKDGLIDKAVAGVSAAIMARELLRAQSQPLPTLESYTLLMGAIALMHRLSLRDFDRAKQMLQTLTERAPRQAIPWAWMAKWHVLRVQQGWSDNPDLDAQARAGLHQARARRGRALLARADGRRLRPHQSAEAARRRPRPLRARASGQSERFARVAPQGHAARVQRRGQAGAQGHQARAEALAAGSAAVLLRFAGGNRRAFGGRLRARARARRGARCARIARTRRRCAPW